MFVNSAYPLSVPPASCTLQPDRMDGATVEVQAGVPVRIPCRSESARPAARIRWLREGADLSGWFHFQFLTKLSTQLYCTRADIGCLHCPVSVIIILYVTSIHSKHSHTGRQLHNSQSVAYSIIVKIVVRMPFSTIYLQSNTAVQ